MNWTDHIRIAWQTAAIAAGLVVLSGVWNWFERRLWRRNPVPGTPSNADLLKLAERHPAPQKWYDE